VFSANTQWNCTSCYRCVVRCPRGVPVTYILQDLATKSIEFGYVRGPQENKGFAQALWWSTRSFGRTDERLMTMRFFFSLGFGEGVRRTMANLKVAIGMIKAGRMHLGLPHRIKGRKGLQAILAKAREIESRH
jgi:quinone-modifying oxidoreductase subunit QmoC